MTKRKYFISLGCRLLSKCLCLPALVLYLESAVIGPTVRRVSKSSICKVVRFFFSSFDAVQVQSLFINCTVLSIIAIVSLQLPLFITCSCLGFVSVHNVVNVSHLAIFYLAILKDRRLRKIKKSIHSQMSYILCKHIQKCINTNTYYNLLVAKYHLAPNITHAKYNTVIVGLSIFLLNEVHSF